MTSPAPVLVGFYDFLISEIGRVPSLRMMALGSLKVVGESCVTVWLFDTSILMTQMLRTDIRIG